MKNKKVAVMPEPEIKLSIEIVPIEHVPIKRRVRRQPKEDFNQAAFRALQETIKKSEA